MQDLLSAEEILNFRAIKVYSVINKWKKKCWNVEDNYLSYFFMHEILCKEVDLFSKIIQIKQSIKVIGNIFLLL